MSALFSPIEFVPPSAPSIPANDIDLDDIPDALDIFYRSETYFLPEGKDFKDLTAKEKKKLRAQYRFSPMKPGQYQGITGFGGMI